jgi:hypothetical protein
MTREAAVHAVVWGAVILFVVLDLTNTFQRLAARNRERQRRKERANLVILP